MPITTKFKAKQASKRLLSSLPERSRSVLERRYGLGKTSKKSTLESIGKTYGITRERVRQIEKYAIAAIRKSESFEKEKPVFDELSSILDSLGVVVTQRELLSLLSDDESMQNHIHFLLVVGGPFFFRKADTAFHERWCVDEEITTKIEESLQKLYESLSNDSLISERKLIDQFLNYLKDLNKKYSDEEIIRRWLSLSKQIGKNPLGEWGRSDSTNVRAKGMRDYAYLAIKQHGSPMHFREVASSISDLFSKKAHEATCHNELIKDDRFVLVGRGLYALKEWGYKGGVVKDVISEILKNYGPLTRSEIIDKVRKERYVKNNTIIVNLQDTTCFRRNSDGTYSIII